MGEEVGVSAASFEGGMMDRNKKRGLNATLVVFFSLVLLVGMTRIHAMIANCDGDEASTIDGFEQQHDVGTRRMLSVSELAAEAERREILEAEARRFLASTSAGYTISYSALSASRVSCPPRSGRSYYTRNCNSASGPVRPYARTCSTYSRCARDSR